MKLALTLPAETAIGLRRFAAEQDRDLPAAAALALREYLVVAGWIEAEPDLEEDGEVAGNA